MTPTAFTIHRQASGPVETWSIDDPRVEQLWLPILGPTPYCILRLFDRELADAGEYFAAHTFRITQLADMLGVETKRAFQSLLRLQRHGLIARDPDDDRAEHPVFVVDRAVRRIGDGDWPKLPASLRQKYGTIEL